MKTSIAIHPKLKKIELSCHPEISFLDIYPKKMKWYLKETSELPHSLQCYPQEPKYGNNPMSVHE